MSDILNKWMVDAEAFELQKLYRVNTDQEYEFTTRQGDFYITLLNRMYNILRETENAEYETRTEELVKVAKAMLVYSEQVSERNFEGIDKVSNHLYVATIYFLIGYEAIASCVLRGRDINDYGTEPAQLIYYIVSGGACNLREIKNKKTEHAARLLRSFMLSGNNNLQDLSTSIERKYERFVFDNLDDFFDTALLVHVIRKFAKHNLRNILTEADPDMDWTDYIRYSLTQHIFSFLPSQENAIRKGLLKFEKAFSLKMPTSAGKSYITELLIYQELRTNPHAKILYLAPLRSLSRELKLRFKKVGRHLGFTSRAIYGGSTFTIDQDILEEARLLISTPESFMVMEDSLEEQLTRFSLVICDEGQLLDSLNRGINYELLLTRLKRIEGIRYLFLSAIIPNIEDVNTWLGGRKNDVGDSDYRPCPIKLANISRGFDLAVKEENYDADKYIIKNFLSNDESEGIGSSQKAKASALALKAVSAGPVMLFTARKVGEMGCMAIGQEIEGILRQGNLPSPACSSVNSQRLHITASYIAYQFGHDHPLPGFIEKGYAYHHGSLPQDIREVLEQNYVDQIIPLLICTNTLAEGVNLPVQTLVLYCLTRYNFSARRNETLDITEIKNIVGRAGRAGKQRFGLVIYPSGKADRPFNNVKSALQNVGLHNIMGTLYDVVRVFYNLRARLDDNGINRILEDSGLASAIDTMITRSVKIDSFDDIDVENIVKESLAYHVGNSKIRENLKRIFRIRHKVLAEKLNKNNFPAFHNTGMTIDDVVKATELITPEALADIDLTAPLSEAWSTFAISVIMQLPSFENGQIEKNNEASKRELDAQEIKLLLTAWINGKQYYEIAKDLNCQVDHAVDLVMFLQNSFHMHASSLVRYIQTLGVETSALEIWIDMIKYGVNTWQKLLLIRSGLTDRIVVNVLFDTELQKYLDFDDANVLQRSMKHFRAKILAYATDASLPELCMEHLIGYLN